MFGLVKKKELEHEVYKRCVIMTVAIQLRDEIEKYVGHDESFEDFEINLLKLDSWQLKNSSIDDRTSITLSSVITSVGKMAVNAWQANLYEELNDLKAEEK